MELILIILSLVGFSFLITESVIANRIKRFFGLESENKTVKALSDYSFYQKNFKHHYFFIPIWVIFKIIRFITEVIDCAGCTSVWITLSYCLITGAEFWIIGIVYLLTLCFMKVI